MQLKPFFVFINLIILAIIIATVTSAFISANAKAEPNPRAPQQLNGCFDATTKAALSTVRSGVLADLKVDPAADLIVRSVLTLNPEGGFQHRTVELVNYNDQTLTYHLDFVVELNTCHVDFAGLKTGVL